MARKTTTRVARARRLGRVLKFIGSLSRYTDDEANKGDLLRLYQKRKMILEKSEVICRPRKLRAKRWPNAGPIAPRLSTTALLSHLYFRVHRHPRAQLTILVEVRLLVAVEIDAHRNTLDYLHIVSGSVFRR